MSFASADVDARLLGRDPPIRRMDGPCGKKNRKMLDKKWEKGVFYNASR